MNCLLPICKNRFKENAAFLAHHYLLAYLVLIFKRESIYNMMGTTKIRKQQLKNMHVFPQHINEEKGKQRSGRTRKK